jgi:hypothetical protein
VFAARAPEQKQRFKALVLFCGFVFTSPEGRGDRPPVSSKAPLENQNIENNPMQSSLAVAG